MKSVNCPKPGYTSKKITAPSIDNHLTSKGLALSIR